MGIGKWMRDLFRIHFLWISPGKSETTLVMAHTNRRFPRHVALAALLVYGLTLSRGITLRNLLLSAQVAGWDWQPMAGQPLLWLLTLPLRCLPAGWIPTGLNLFSAVCGALTLGLLARTIELLPWDRPWNPDHGWANKLPMLLACVVCGLEFSFWQEATAATGETLDMLLLAAAIWCLLEYRAGKEPRWLNAAALLWGLGLVENWVMLITLPLFVASLIWLRRLRFFKVDFLLRMALLGLAGFSIYALLPLVNGLAPHSPWGFGEAWHMSLRMTKNTILALYIQFWVVHRLMTVVVVVCFLLPTLPCLVRLRDEGTIYKSQGERLQIWIYRALRAVLLLMCLWLAFDPTIGPRQIVLQQFGLSLPLLSFDYLNALGAGFLAGNLLLAVQPVSRHRRRSGLWWQTRLWLGRVTAPTLVVVSGLVTAGLIARNAPAMTLANRHPLQSFGDLALRSLPAGGGVVLSDDPQRLVVFQAALARRGESRQWLPVNTKSLPAPEYRARLERKRPSGWLTASNRHELDPFEMLQLLDHVAQTNRLFYLHPSFGYFFEQFYLKPHGAVYEMKPYPKNSFNGPPLSSPEMDQTEKIWDEVWQTEREPVSQLDDQRHFGLAKIQKTLSHYFYRSATPHHQIRLLDEWSSTALDGWGVELQRNGQLSKAHRRFEQAMVLNTNNLAALINLQCNTNLQAGNKMGLAGADAVARQLGNLRRLSVIVSRCGPFDDPVFCYLLGNVYRQTGLFRQAVQQFQRAQTLAPAMLAPEFALAQLYSRRRMDDKVFEIVNHLRKETRGVPVKDAVDVELSLLEANSWLSQTNLTNARGVLQSVLKQHPDDARTLSLMLQAYLAFGDFTNALQLVASRLARDPDNVAALVNQAGILMQMGDSSNAIPILNHALAITNLPFVRIDRAIACLQTENYQAAETDCLELEKAQVETCRVHYCLAKIAEHRHDTNLAIHHFELCLSNAPSGSIQGKEARARLNALKLPAQKH
jgi:tetratricopeptide (TPR) repeat protein